METLLDMDRIPTVEEMKAFFKKNDWTGVKLSNEGKPQEVLRVFITQVSYDALLFSLFHTCF